MGKLVIDVAALQSLSSNLTTVASEFENANTNSDAIASAVGHPGLAGTVRDFAHGWDDTRGKMVEGIRALADSSQAVADGWIELDTEGANALTESAPSGGGGGGGYTMQAAQ